MVTREECTFPIFATDFSNSYKMHYFSSWLRKAMPRCAHARSGLRVIKQFLNHSNGFLIMTRQRRLRFRSWHSDDPSGG
jgi:hypothetical protein